MEINEIPVKALKPYKRNPRKNDKAVEYVANSIRQFGFKVPIVIDSNYEIVCGHTRWKAAKTLGMETVPCILADDLNEDQIRAFRLADNKTAEMADWDFDLLELEFNDIDPDLFDMSDFGFFQDEEQEEQKPTEVTEDDFDESTVKESVCKRGQVWQLGDHRLMCGDSTNRSDADKLLGGVKADMVFTDPPYGVAIGDKNATLNSVQPSGRCCTNIAGDTMTEAELYSMLKEAFINVREHCKDDASYYVTSPQGGSLGLMMMMMKDAGLEVRHVLMWEKNSATFSLGRLDYDYQHEPMFYTWTKSHHNYRKGENRTTVWKYDKPRKCDLHPTMKPVALVANAILDGTKENDVVLDAFGGSGSTLIACEQLDRRCFMMELDPHYCSVILQRYINYKGSDADVYLLDGDNKIPYSEIAK
jgi:site-specific DNA-methyltransferase (adenine-specific)